MKRVHVFALMLLLTLGVFAGLTTEASAASWSDPYLQNLLKRDVMQGDKSGELYPERMITRAEFAAMLNRAFGFTQKGSTSFKDVPATSWYAGDISVAAYQGYMKGDGKGAKPDGNLTREEAVAMLCRALKIPETETASYTLSDERNFSNWSRGYIHAAVDRAFVSGYPDNSFRPANNITRGEAAKMLSELSGEIVNNKANNVGGVINGNVTVSSSGVALSDVTVLGDLYITEGVGTGYTQLKNVSVNGEVIISGAGESNVGQSSVVLTDCNINNLTVDVAKRKILTLKTDRATSVYSAVIKSSTYLEELSSNYEGFDKVIVDGPAGIFLNLTGSFGDVRVMSSDATVGLYKGSISSLTVDETATKTKIFLEKGTEVNAIYFDAGATVTGTGEIDSVLINNDGVTIAQLPENIYIRPGVTAIINGKPMGSLDAEVDGMDPDFMSDYPKADKILPISFTEFYKTNKAGKIYYGVYAREMPAPSKDELMGTNTPPKNALKTGNIGSLPDKEVSVPVSGLKAGTEYVVYSLFVDLRGKTSSVERNFVETVDNVMPTLLAGYPKLASTDKNSATITLIPNKNTGYYWAVMPDKSVAPTVEQLYTQKLSGAVSNGVTDGGVMNTPKDITVGGSLNENAPYVFYVILRDSADNMSKIAYKQNFTTKDLTAPKFTPADTYPKVSVSAATQITVDYMVDEPCTLYWSAAKQGSSVLPILSGELDKTSQKARDIVKSGTSAFKFGKSTASEAMKKYTVDISGLEKQMPYDIYLLLEDKNGNQSDVIAVLAGKTLDTVPPTATLSSDQEINEKYSVDASIKLTFSEIVCSSKANIDGTYPTLKELFKGNKNSLKNYIKLLNTSLATNPEQVIDWNEVTVEEVDAKTVITFNPKALGLANNSAYSFRISNPNYIICDTSKNQMKGTLDLSFKTVAPLTYFSVVQNFDSNKYDAVFYINPQAQNTDPAILFDIMLRSDHDLEFKLYASDTIAGLDGGAVSSTTHALTNNYVKRFSDYFGEKTAYKDLKDTYYAIKLTKVDSKLITGGQIPLTTDINLKMNAVIGNDQGIGSLVGKNSEFDLKLKDALEKNRVSTVTAPKDPFEMQIFLRDNVAPKMISEEFNAGDRQVLMSIQADKACKVYYFAVPKERDTSPITDPRQLMNQPSDLSQYAVAGSFEVTGNSAIPTQHTIEGLKPPGNTTFQSNGEYHIYYCLLGDSPTPSDVYPSTFFTTAVRAPEMVDQLESSPGNNKVQIGGSWDSSCRMYYLVYPGGTLEPTIEEIMGKQQPVGKVVATGSIMVKKDEKFTLDIQNISSTFVYDIYVVGQKFIGDAPSGPASVRRKLSNFTSQDFEKPRVENQKIIASLTGSTVGPIYNGTFTVSFSEGLYLYEQDTSKRDPVTAAVLSSIMQGSSGVSVKTSTSTGDKGAVKVVTFEFSKIQNNADVFLGKTIGDEAGNNAGTLSMHFYADGTEDPYWIVKFLED